MDAPALQPLTLYPVGQAVGAARRYVNDCLRELDAHDVGEAAELGVSELVTNAILHGRTPLTITVRRMETGRVRIDVIDGSPLLPEQRHNSVSATTGRGLRMVASVSLDWGVQAGHDQHGPGKSVWFEPSDTPDAAGPGDWDADIEALLR